MRGLVHRCPWGLDEVVRVRVRVRVPLGGFGRKCWRHPGGWLVSKVGWEFVPPQGDGDRFEWGGWLLGLAVAEPLFLPCWKVLALTRMPPEDESFEARGLGVVMLCRTGGPYPQDWVWPHPYGQLASVRPLTWLERSV